MEKLLFLMYALVTYGRVPTPHGLPVSNRETETRAGNFDAGTIAPQFQSAAPNSRPTRLTNSKSASGGGGTITYQWYSSTNKTVWTAIAGATGLTCLPSTSTSYVYLYYRRRATDGTGQVLDSNTVTIAFIPPTPVISPGKTVISRRSGEFVTFTVINSPKSGKRVFEWKSNGICIGTGVPTHVPVYYVRPYLESILYVRCRIIMNGIASDWGYAYVSINP